MKPLRAQPTYLGFVYESYESGDPGTMLVAGGTVLGHVRNMVLGQLRARYIAPSPERVITWGERRERERHEASSPFRTTTSDFWVDSPGIPDDEVYRIHIAVPEHYEAMNYGEIWKVHNGAIWTAELELKPHYMGTGAPQWRIPLFTKLKLED